MTTQEIINQVGCLPLEERIQVVDALLKTLNHLDPKVDQKWGTVSKRRLDDLRSGRVKPVPGDEVTAKARKLFSK